MKFTVDYPIVTVGYDPASKALSTVDVLSGGRLTVVAGTGYLRSEFLALNVDMSLRNELFDESLEVLRGVWSEVRDAAAAANATAAPLTIQVHTPQAGVMQRPGSAEEHRDHLGQLAAMPGWTRSSCGRLATLSTTRSRRCTSTRRPY